jgi:hypothetical protein
MYTLQKLNKYTAVAALKRVAAFTEAFEVGVRAGYFQ